jgi:hypothetical protein
MPAKRKGRTALPLTRRRVLTVIAAGATLAMTVSQPAVARPKPNAPWADGTWFEDGTGWVD